MTGHITEYVSTREMRVLNQEEVRKLVAKYEINDDFDPYRYVPPGPVCQAFIMDTTKTAVIMGRWVGGRRQAARSSGSWPPVSRLLQNIRRTANRHVCVAGSCCAIHSALQKRRCWKAGNNGSRRAIPVRVGRAAMIGRSRMYCVSWAMTGSALKP